MTPAQGRAARALLNITQPQLATAAGLGLSTVIDFERGRRQVSAKSIKSIQRALQKAGITFTETGAELTGATLGLRAGFAEPPSIFEEAVDLFGRSAYEVRKDLSGAQIRAARALLRWSAGDLAREAALGINTIRRAELAEKGTSLTAANQLAIRRALEAAGVLFIDENGGAGAGVRLRK